MFRFNLGVVMLLVTLSAVASQPALATILYSQDFNGASDGDTVDTLANWSSTWGTHPGYITDTAELATLALSQQGHANQTQVELDVTSYQPSVAYPTYEYSAEWYVFDETTGAQELLVLGNSAQTNGYWARARWHLDGTWFVRLYNDAGAQILSEFVADPAGDVEHSVTVKAVFDTVANEFWIDVGGVQSTKKNFDADDWGSLDAMAFFLDPRSPAISAHVDNVSIDAIPEPSVLALLGMGIGLSFARRWKRS